MKQKTVNGITEGVIWKQLLLFFFPILVGTFFQQLYNTVDAIIVGQNVGKDALASVGGSSSQIINTVVGFFTGLSAGASVIIAQFFGAGNRDEVEKTLYSAYAFSILGGVMFGVLGIILTPNLLKIMNTPEELMEQSALYVQVYFAGLIFIFIYNMGASMLRAIGDSKRPLYILIICCVVNILLDFLLVLAFQMGVLGVAVATLISQAVSALLVTLVIAKRTPGVTFHVKKIRFHKRIMRQMLQIGIPTGIQSSMYSISNVIVQAALNNFGVNTMAAWAAYGKLDCLFWMVNGAFGIAITTFVGQNSGAGKWDRVKKSVRVCLAMALGTALCFSTLLLAFADPLLHIFTNDLDVVAIGVEMIGVITPTYFLFVFIEILDGALRARRLVMVPTIMSLVDICLFRILWVVFIVPNGTLKDLIMCYPITWALCGIMVIIYYIYKTKKDRDNIQLPQM